MEETETELVGHDVVIIKIDNYKKIGKLLSVKNGLATIQFRNGEIQAIPFVQISTIKAIGGDDGRK